MNTLTKEQIKMLAEGERMMDRGEVPFVRLGGERIMCDLACMAELCIEQGQTITGAVFTEILKWKIADCEAKITEQKLREAGR
jgi:hypothetical protein